MPRLQHSFSGSMVLRYLRSRRGFTAVVTVFSMAGIMLGVAALIIVMAVMSGFRDELMSRILGITGHATITVQNLTTEKAVQLAADLEKIPGVIDAAPYVSGEVMVSANGKATGGFVRGIRPEDLPPQLKNPDRLTLAPGTPVLASGTLLVGQGLAKQLALIPGNQVRLISPQGSATPFGFIPAITGSTVGGVFSVGMVQFDQGLVLANLADMQAYLGMPGKVQALEIKVKDPMLIGGYLPKFGKVLVQDGIEPLEFTVSTWQESGADFFRALEVERTTMFIILSLIVVVAAFNIVTGQMMLVKDKLADIAILRTMGATKGQILKVFFLNGMLVGTLGMLAGLGLGLLVVWQMQAIVGFVQVVTGVELFPKDVYFLSELPAQSNPGDVLAVLAITVFFTIISSIYPAWVASWYDPVQLLKQG